MYTQHLNEIRDDLIVVQIMKEHLKIHKVLQEINEVKKNLKNQCVILNLVVVFEKLNTVVENYLIVLRSLEEWVVVYLLYYHYNYLHVEVEA